MLKNLSNKELTKNLKSLIQKEREVLNQVLEHLEEMERRRIHLSLGFSSLFDYCVNELKYSESAAQRRISSMRLIKEVPQVKEKIDTGELTLTTLSMAQSFFRREEKEQKTKYSPYEKHELLKTLETKSKREVEKVLIEKNPLSALTKEKERLITPDTFEIRLTLTQEQMDKLKRLKELKPNLFTNQAALDWLLSRVLKQIDPIENRKNRENKDATGVADKRTNKQDNDESEKGISDRETKRKASSRKHISKSKKAFIWKNANAQCEYISPITKRRCPSKSTLQIDHIHPLGLGGSNELKNLRLLCQQHNISEAMRYYGNKKIEPFLKR